MLWDIDGTLLEAGRLGADVFAQAVEATVGRFPAGEVAMSGKTDPQIVREYLALLELSDGDRHLPGVLAHLESLLAAGSELVASKGRVLPGVVEVLTRLAARPGVTQSVLTGNIAANAALKLAAFGLDRWLDLEIGAYGSDDADRRALVPIAIERAGRLRGLAVDPGQVWVVGDTPHDLACARAGRARCLLVGTGHTPLSELDRLGPEAVLADLADVERVLSILDGLGP